ncbi:3-phosphoshikimate 1-carboxyvinyltransferase [Hypnocyclicus thermotrophus]|uniref:3-phosphoshikimate 1-carboxyvinyltransferase n=1 Tax=Hypnocyclicus thermotrophus TaxID=1627895 RepID=A0AA46DZU4_9FUSO|nr:3-phosphoshikimate 1-carboxyvinyltransferase [Hypnocyclicus thermotrophus]TDT71766.1 3-phosphoshikimate 1-carboxyvinyltransferase [Hypnocyclicus thermotrophus]
MKKVIINPEKNNIKGEIVIPPSKSYAHRAIICASLAKGRSIIENIDYSVDINSTIEIMTKMGAKIEKNGSVLTIDGTDNIKITDIDLNCNESGSTIRFLIPLALARYNRAKFLGKGKLITRPLDVYYNIFEKQGIKYETDNGKLPLFVEGELKPDTFIIPGNISSQFISGLMFTLPLLNGDSIIKIKGNLESKAYVDLTLDMLNRFGIEIENRDYQNFYIKGNQKYKAQNYRVEGDFSQAAFWIVAGLIGENPITLKGMNINSLQGDKEILNIAKRMGGQLDIKEEEIIVYPSKTKGIKIDVSQCPDIGPILSVLGSVSEGETNIVNAERLRIKECDRITASVSELAKLGANIQEIEDSIKIIGVERLSGNKTDSWNDHRIAMSLAIASIKIDGEIEINNSECVKKSYPSFWKEFTKIGGHLNECNVG